MEKTCYGDKIADSYDERYPSVNPAQIDFLAKESGSGPVLELGIGTGRVAIPLKKKGIDIHGIEISQKMVDVLHEKPLGKEIPVTVSDFVEIPNSTKFSLIFSVFNSFFGLTSREEQIKGFQSISDSLLPSGRFIMDGIIPDYSSFSKNQAFSVVSVTSTAVELSASMTDPVSQVTISQKIEITEDGIKLIPTEMRHALPSELDLMAEKAGLKLVNRFGSWDGLPFKTGASGHLSIYEKA